MTAPSLLDELEGMVRLAEKATPGEWSHQESTSDTCGFEVVQKCLNGDVVAGEYGIHEYDDARLIAAAVNFLRAHHAELADMANELRVARESFKRCDEICKCTAEGWRTAEEYMAKRLEAAERDAARYRWLLNQSVRIEARAWVWEPNEPEMIHPDERFDAATQEGEE